MFQKLQCAGSNLVFHARWNVRLLKCGLTDTGAVVCVGPSGAEGEGAFGICSAQNRPWICLLVSELFPEFWQPPVLKGLISLSSPDQAALELGCLWSLMFFGVGLGIQVGKAAFCQDQWCFQSSLGWSGPLAWCRNKGFRICCCFHSLPGPSGGSF